VIDFMISLVEILVGKAFVEFGRREPACLHRAPRA